MEKEKSNAGLIIKAYIVISILTTLYFVIVSRAIADYRFKVGDKLRFKGFITSFLSLLTNRKQQIIFFLLEVSILLILSYLLYLYLHKPKKFASDTIEITPTIIIPAPAGQGQFGSKWFMADKEKEKIFAVNTLDLNNEKVKDLIECGDEDIREGIKKLNSGISIKEIEKEIDNKNKSRQNMIEEKNFNDEYADEFNSFEENDADFYNNIDLFLNNQELMFENYENNIELENEFLSKQIANEIKEQNEKELKNKKPYNPNEDKNKFFKSGGLITGYYYSKEANKEKIYYVDKDTHSVIIGATRSGKSRCLVLQSMGNTALAGESIVVTDPKGELYAYTSKFMEQLGYEVICLDFKNAKNSSKYNLLQPIINARKDVTPEQPEGDIETIVKFAEELSNMLIKEAKGENPMWTDNAKTMITGAILSLVLENSDEEVQNLTNVYRFINSGEGRDLNPNKDNLFYFIKSLQKLKPESPIINAMLGIINTPTETRGGFSTNASAATRLFTQPSIWEITHKSNVDLSKMGERKQILYFILPDQDTSYYKIVSIIVKQMYNELVKISDKYGGRLPIRVNFYLDEFGNFAPIPDLGTILTVAGGRGMRFNLFLQGFPQITQKYDKETTEIVKSNCETWVYLKANDTATLKEISDKLGSYTIYSNSESMNMQNSMTTSNSSSQSLQKRNLLLPEEVMAIDRPYLLVMNGNNAPAINQAPDISKLSMNKIYGLGTPEHNTQLRMIRDRQRPIVKSEEEMKYWNIYNDIKQYCIDNIDPTKDFDGRPLQKPRQISDDEFISHIVNFLKNKDEEMTSKVA